MEASVLSVVEVVGDDGADEVGETSSGSKSTSVPSSPSPDTGTVHGDGDSRGGVVGDVGDAVGSPSSSPSLGVSDTWSRSWPRTRDGVVVGTWHSTPTRHGPTLDRRGVSRSDVGDRGRKRLEVDSTQSGLMTGVSRTSCRSSTTYWST